MRKEDVGEFRGKRKYQKEHSRYDKDRKTDRRGAKTFRRGRAIAFLETLQVKRSTLKKQLELPELQSIHPTLVGELKAIDMIIHEFGQVFDLHELDETSDVTREKELTDET